ncbi:MAG: MOSC domain-containing protein [Streptosporangiaceae bacterium]
MATARVLSVSTGLVRELVSPGRTEQTAIDKRPADGRILAGRLGLAGDEHGDTENHGGPDQALYAYGREDLDWWTGRLGRELPDGAFGENLTTAGIDVNAALIGETWAIGAVIVQVTSPRIPCATFRAWTGERAWVKRFAAAGRPGAYLRVLAEGEIGAGDGIEVLERPAERVTVTESMRAFYGDQDLMRTLLTVPGRGGRWDEIGAHVLGRATA